MLCVNLAWGGALPCIIRVYFLKTHQVVLCCFVKCGFGLCKVCLEQPSKTVSITWSFCIALSLKPVKCRLTLLEHFGVFGSHAKFFNYLSLIFPVKHPFTSGISIPAPYFVSLFLRCRSRHPSNPHILQDLELQNESRSRFGYQWTMNFAKAVVSMWVWVKIFQTQETTVILVYCECFHPRILGVLKFWLHVPCSTMDIHVFCL